jgi:hypothetical protein
MYRAMLQMFRPFLACFMLDLLFDPEAGSDIFLGNVTTLNIVPFVHYTDTQHNFILSLFSAFLRLLLSHFPFSLS